MTDIDVHPLVPPELHQAAKPHARVPEGPVLVPPRRVQHRSHGLGALEQQLRSPGPVRAPGPVQPAAQRDRVVRRAPAGRGRPAPVADVTVEVIEAVQGEGQPLGAQELRPAPQKRLFFLRLPAYPLTVGPSTCGERGLSALGNLIPRESGPRLRGGGHEGEWGAFNPLQEPSREGERGDGATSAVSKLETEGTWVCGAERCAREIQAGFCLLLEGSKKLGRRRERW